MRLKLIQNIKKDVQNWQNGITIKSYGLKWKDYIPSDLSIDCVHDEKCITDYLKNRYYNSGEIDLYIKALQKKLNIPEIKKDLESLVRKKFPNKIINIFITTFSRAPYSVVDNYFYLRYRPQKKDLKKSETNIYHELMHFLFHKYYWDTCKDAGLNNEKIHILKESLTALLNPILKQRKLPLDVGYSAHQELRAKLEKLRRKENNFNKFIEKAIKIVK